jgi:hypothetical protein
MGNNETKPISGESKILTDANGNPTHVVLTIEAFQEMEELIEDLQAFQEFYETRESEELIPLKEVKKSLGLQG